MALSFIESLSAELNRHGALVRLVVAEKKGSAPREVGASMFVGAGHISGTIGGGALEYQAILEARKLLTRTLESGRLWGRTLQEYPLGPTLGQCCGGSVKLLMEVFTKREFVQLRPPPSLLENTRSLVVRSVTAGSPVSIIRPNQEYSDKDTSIGRIIAGLMSDTRQNRPLLTADSKTSSRWFIEPYDQAETALYLYGAGHVGREIVRVINGLPFNVHWIDFEELRFPQNVPEHVRVIITSEPHKIAENSKDEAFHLVMTHSHPLDLAICHAVLKKDSFRYLGLIGSETKRARFVKRLRESGIDEQKLDRMICPIGLNIGGGRDPKIIAVSVVAQIISELDQKLKSIRTPEKPVEMANYDGI